MKTRIFGSQQGIKIKPTTPCWFRTDRSIRDPLKYTRYDVFCTGRTREYGFGNMVEILLAWKDAKQIGSSSPFMWVSMNHFVNPELTSSTPTCGPMDGSPKFSNQ